MTTFQPFWVAPDDANLPEDVLLLEPRDVFDKALVGFAHQGGITMAVYSKEKVIEALREDEMDEEDAIEHYNFNVSGSIGTGYPVFMLNEEGE